MGTQLTDELYQLHMGLVPGYMDVVESDVMEINKFK
jgi:hypothetical protein